MRIHAGDIVWLDMGFGIHRIGIVITNAKSTMLKMSSFIPLRVNKKKGRPIARVKWFDADVTDAVEGYISTYLVLYCPDLSI